jgi:hypothetical protein
VLEQNSLLGIDSASMKEKIKIRRGNTQEQAAQYALEACQTYSSIPDTCEVVLVVGSKEGTIFQK